MTLRLSLFFFVSALLAAPFPAHAQDQASPRPNILWICTDQQRWDTIHALGNAHIRTPNLDRLCATGVAFTHAFVPSPICTPSRAGFLTGMYPSTLHACINGNERWGEAAPLVTKMLADAGYDCGLAGKLHLSRAQGVIEKRPDDGYRVFHWSHHPNSDWPAGDAYSAWIKKQGFDLKKLYKEKGYIPEELHQTTWCANMALDFIREKRKGPWLFSLNCFAPHPPFRPPEKILARFQVDRLPGPLFRASDLDAQIRLKDIGFQSEVTDPRLYEAKRMQAKYWAEIELIDKNVGRLLDELEKTGQRKNTLIVFSTDHGEMLGDHGLRQKGCRFYEGLVHVPLLVSWPGRCQQRLKSDALVETIDIAPTLLEAAGLTVPDRMQARSLLPILTGKADAHNHRDFVRCEYFQTLEGPPIYATMYRDRRYKLIVYHGTVGKRGSDRRLLDLGELFDLQSDPDEFDNLWGKPKHAALKSELLLKSFSSLALSIDLGPRRMGRY